MFDICIGFALPKSGPVGMTLNGQVCSAAEILLCWTMISAAVPLLLLLFMHASSLVLRTMKSVIFALVLPLFHLLLPPAITRTFMHRCVYMVFPLGPPSFIPVLNRKPRRFSPLPMTKANTAGWCVNSTFAMRMQVSTISEFNCSTSNFDGHSLSGKGFDYHYHGDPFGDPGAALFVTLSTSPASRHTWCRQVHVLR
jgi:hypothetical protein